MSKEELQQNKINRAKRQIKALKVDLENAIESDKPGVRDSISQHQNYLISLEANR